MFERIWRSPFARNVVIVASGTASAQAITLAFSPIITRLYGPEAFGLQGAFMAVLALTTPVAALSYPIGLVLPRDDDEAQGLAQLSARIALAIAAALVVVFLFADGPIARLLKMEEIQNYLWLVPLAMLFTAWQSIMQQWLIRKKLFKVTARIAVSQSLILNGAKSALGLIWPTGALLIVLNTLGNLLYSVQLWLGTRRWGSADAQLLSPPKQQPSLRALAHQHRDFPIYRTPQVLLNAISHSAPTLVLASLFGPAIAGFYTLSRSVTSAPVELLGKSIGNVFYAQIAESVNAGKDPRPFLHRATLSALAVATPPFVVGMLWGAPLFAWAFGSQWYTAGEYAQWVALWLLFSLAARPVIAIIPVIDLQGSFLIAEAIFILLRVGGLLAGGLIYNDALTAVALYSAASGGLFISLYLMVMWRLSKMTKH